MTQPDHLQLALAAAAMRTWNWDIQSGRVDWSGGIEELVGLPPGSFDGTFDAYQRVLHHEDRADVEAAIQKAVEDPTANYEIDHRIVLPNGQLRWLSCRGQVIRDSAGTPVNMLGLVWDITARKTAEAELVASERRSAFLANASMVLGSSLDCAATLASVATSAVPAVADACVIELAQDDRTPFPPVGAHIDSSKLASVLELSRQLAPTIAGEIRSSDQPGISSSIVVPIVARGKAFGSILLIRTDRAPIFDEQDLAMAMELGRLTGSAVDNARLYADARDADRRKDEFLAMLGHELRNPLAPILTALEVMRLGDDSAFKSERNIIHRQVKHVVRLVDDLLDVSRIASGKIAIRKELVELSRIISKSVEMASPLFEVRSQNLAVSVSHGIVVVADQQRLSQAIGNLLINAAKFTEPGGRISLEATAAAGEVVIRIRDSGIGIAPEILPHIFDLFVQHARSLDRSQGGLGIGLTIVRSLVSLHGGSVSAHSDGLGQGSEFVVRLPSAVGAIAPSPERHEPIVAGERLRVLIVDDNADASTMLAKALHALEHTTHVAHDGPSALATVPTFKPEVALLDIGLPVMDGYEVARRLRDLVAGIRLVAITGYGQESDRALSHSAGFDEHLVKPVDLDELLGVLSRFQSSAP